MNAAHLHLIINHIPVLGAIAVFILILYSARKKEIAVTRLTLMTAVLVGLFAIPVFLSGDPAEEVVEDLPGVTKSLIESHEDSALYALMGTEIVAVMAAFGMYRLRRDETIPQKYFLGIGVLAFLTAILMLYTANLGGQIRHTEIRNEVQ